MPGALLPPPRGFQYLGTFAVNGGIGPPPPLERNVMDLLGLLGPVLDIVTGLLGGLGLPLPPLPV